MYLFLFFLMLGIPIGAFLSLLIGIKVIKFNKALAGVIILAAMASFLLALWEFRYDIDLISNLITDQWGYRGMQMADDLDLDRFFLPICIISGLSVLLARFLWKPQYGSALLPNLALVSWALAGLSFFLLTSISISFT